MENQKEFRIVEDVKGFYVQQKREISTTIGMWFWKETKTEVRWRDVDCDGQIVFMSLGFKSGDVKFYRTIEKAKEAVEKFKKYPIYHYEVHEPKFPIREVNSFCETPEEKCTMSYCDENGCQNRKRELVDGTLLPEFPTDEPSKF